MVPSIDQCDMDTLARRARLVAFDLDNTLARSKQPMDSAMASLFSRLTSSIDVAVVTGGSYELVVSQVLGVLTDEAHRDRLQVLPTCGASRYQWKDGRWSLARSHDLDVSERDRAMAALETHARDMGLWPQHPWGEVIEDRGTQITFSALGQHAPEQAKRAFDPGCARLKVLAEAVQRDLPDLMVRPGGFTSVDVCRRGVDKAYAMRELAALQGIRLDEILFVGDRMEPGGNDYPAVEAGALGVRVSGPEDTRTLISALIERLSDGISSGHGEHGDGADPGATIKDSDSRTV